MTTRPARRTTTSRPLGAVLALGLSASLLGGCGIGESLVGLHDAPSENPSVASVNEDGAVATTTRVLGAAAEASTAENTSPCELTSCPVACPQ